MKLLSECKSKIKKLPLKKVYYLLFLLLVILPILGVLLATLAILNQQFKQQAIENIRQNQQTIIAELKSDIDGMSMRMASIVFANNNEIIQTAVAAGEETNQRFEYAQQLANVENLYLEPEKDLISVCFYMKDKSSAYLKNYILKENVSEADWYQAAMEKKNKIYVGSYETKSVNDLFYGGRDEMFILIFALAPDYSVDRSGKVEMAALYHSSKVADRIKENNRNYEKGKNSLGYARITDGQGNCIFSTGGKKEKEWLSGRMCVKSPVEFFGNTWYVENYIRPGELTADFGRLAIGGMGTAVLVLLLVGYFSVYFLKSIVKPVEAVNQGLRQVEEGNLDVFIEVQGQFEIRNMIHQFNVMVQRLRALIREYEEKVRKNRKSPSDCLAELVERKSTPEQIRQENPEFFEHEYLVLGMYADYGSGKKQSRDLGEKMLKSFYRNSQYASKCCAYMETPSVIYLMYRALEPEYLEKAKSLLKELQNSAGKEFGISLFVCIGGKQKGAENFLESFSQVERKMSLRHLVGKERILALETELKEADRIMEMSEDWSRLADALYLADEKNVTEEREKLFDRIEPYEMEEIRIHMLSVILAVGRRFEKGNDSFTEVFGQEFEYSEKIGRIEDRREARIWLSNYFAWIIEYAESRLEIQETDMVIKAKRYIASHYDDPSLSLGQAAEYVGLNEKYFTNKFTKEAGETFSEYLASVRVQKAKQLLRTTSFKVYEIAEMVGYHNVESFNRAFKKISGVSPTKYRNGEKIKG